MTKTLPATIVYLDYMYFPCMSVNVLMQCCIGMANYHIQETFKGENFRGSVEREHFAEKTLVEY